MLYEGIWARQGSIHKGQIEEEFGMMGGRSESRKKKSQISESISSIILTLFELVLLAACIIYLLDILHKNPSSGSGRIIPELIPVDLAEFSVQKLFMPDDLFNPIERNEESDDAWETLHKRWVIINTPARYGLPPSEPFPRNSNSSNEVYAPAVFHQLHCLRLIRFSWYSLIANGPRILTDPIDIPNNPHNDAVGPHIEHCFDFLRQALMCHADLALEPFVAGDGVTRIGKGTSGWGSIHQCRRWDKLLEWVENHTFPGWDD